MELGGSNRSRAVGAFVAAGAALAPPVASRVALHLLDTLAAIVACRDLRAAQVARDYVTLRSGAEPGAGALTATILGTTRRTNLADAALAGAMTAHAAEINDFIPSVFVQPGPAVVASALAAGEATGARLRDVRSAIAIGYEIAARLPYALGVGNLRRAGVANHAVGPTFGAAAAASALLGFSADEVCHVLSAAAQQAGGSWQWLLDEEHVEKAFVFAGVGARNGIEAALLVRAGYRGVADALDRPGTWFTSPLYARAGGDGDLDRIVDGLGKRWCFDDAAFKRYPVGGPAQPAVEALLALAGSVATGDVASVVVAMPGRADAFRDAAMPALNLRYLASIILIDGRLDFVAAQSLERMHTDDAVAALMARVEVRQDPEQEAAPGQPRTESARVTISTTDGRTLERFVPHVLGFPSHPMQRGDVEAKARALVAPRLGARRADELVALCREADATVADIVGAVAAADEPEAAVA